MFPARSKFSLLLFLCAYLAAVLAYSAEYFVSPDGNDGNAGTSASRPWKTIAKANATLQPGDTVYLRGGTYNDDPIRPSRSGTSSAPIRYVAYQGERPVLTSGKKDGLAPAIDLTGRSYIVIDGVHVDGQRAWPNARVKHFAEFSNTSYSVIQNSHFQYANGWHGVRMVEGSHHNRFLNNYVDYVGTWDDGTGQDSGDVFQIKGGAHHNLVAGNVFRRGAHNLMQIRANYNVVRDNVFDNDWSDVLGAGKGGRNLTLGGTRNLFENNVVRKSSEAIDEPDNAGMKTEGASNIVRRNFIFSNRHEGITSEAYGGMLRIENNRIYHNTFYDNGGPAWGVWLYPSGELIRGNVFKNNIVYGNRRIGGADLHFRLEGNPSGLMGNSLVERNLIATKSPGDAIIEIRGGGGNVSVARAEKDFPENFRGNIEAVPIFVSPNPSSPEDFALADGSPGIDEAAPLTYTANAGSGKVVALEDASYFTDGFEIWEGDRIQIGGSAPVRIVKVDYGANTVTLASEIQWEKGAPVTLEYHGKAPDIGAYEVRLGAAPTQRRPKSPRSLTGIVR